MQSVEPVRALRWIRGIIHAHSVYSHDACDNEPFLASGLPNLDCLHELRAAMCTNREDFFMLTDHKATMASWDDWSMLLLYDATAGDTLVEKDGAPVANRVACGDGTSVLLMQGHEDDIMAVGMERHIEGTAEERDAFYSRRDAEASQIYRSKLHALVIQNHTEHYTAEDLASRGLDGIEIFNTHAALLPATRQQDLHVSGSGALEGLLPFFDFNESTWPDAPHPDLGLLGFLEDFVVYNQLWDELLGRGRMLGVLGTDVHRNTYNFVLKDGDRGDSYRRMIRWFSNWVLMPPGEVTPDALKAALAAGRVAGVFEVIGTPHALDFYAEAQGTVYEIGDEVELAKHPVLHARVPKILGLDPRQETPDVVLSLSCGGNVVLETTGELEFVPTSPCAYRLDIRIVPRHLTPFLGRVASLATQTYPWVKFNPIYVRE